MTGQPINVLIVEDQLLIAMDLERILGEIHPCIVRVCRHENMEKELSEGRFDIVFADVGPLQPNDFSFLKKTLGGKGALAFLCSSEPMSRQAAIYKPAAILEKPFDVEAVRSFVLGFSNGRTE